MKTKPNAKAMNYQLQVYSIWEFGQRKDAQGQPHQEDSLFPAHGKATPEDRVFILCDGMGGHDAGEVASAAVCEAMGGALTAGKSLDEAIDAAYRALNAHDTGAAKKMGTTMTALIFTAEGCVAAHMGDSRIYQIRPGATAKDTQIIFRTEDHSLVNDLIRIGELTEEEAKHSKQKNIITRAMQPCADSERCKASVKLLTDIRPGDYFYLCSDGMLEEMNDQQLCHHFSHKGGDAPTKVANLIRATQENRDNHTAFLIHVSSVDSQQEKKRRSWWPW